MRRRATPQVSAKCRTCGSKIVKQDPALFGHGAWFHHPALPNDTLHMGVPR